MPRTIVAAAVSVFLVVLLLFLAALRSCESPTEPRIEPVEYPNTHEQTTTSEGLQYDNALPDTGGLSL